jgi:hypothetical protein
VTVSRLFDPLAPHTQTSRVDIKMKQVRGPAAAAGGGGSGTGDYDVAMIGAALQCTCSSPGIIPSGALLHMNTIHTYGS